MQFEIQPLTQQSEPVGSPVRSDTLTWVDSVSSGTIVGEWEVLDEPGAAERRLAGRPVHASGRHQLG